MNTKITILELADLMAESTSTSSRMCELFIRELFATVSQALIDGESVKIKGIGTFKISHVKARKSTNVNTGEPTELSSHNRLTFTPDKTLAEAVNHPFAQFETVILDDQVTDEKLAEIDEQYPSILFDSSDEPLPLPPSETDVPSPSPVVAPVVGEPLEVDLPQPPDMPVPPPPEDIPLPDDEVTPTPQVSQQPAADVKEAPASEPKAEKAVKDTEEPEAPKATEAKATQTKATEASKATEAKATEAPQAKPAEEPVKRRPMLVGIPIDGPSQPVPSQEQVEEAKTDRHFYRPEPRNAYTPTPEQIEEASHKTNYRWLWALLCLLTAGVLIWLIARGGSENVSEPDEALVVAADTLVTDGDSVPEAIAEAKPEVKPEAKPEVKPEAKPENKPEAKAEEKPQTEKPKKNGEVTDVVTSQIVLTTLAEKHYGSPWFWVYIYEENVNRGIINNPNNIRPGTRVVIPPASKYGINPNDKASLKKAQRKSWEYLKDY